MKQTEISDHAHSCSDLMSPETAEWLFNVNMAIGINYGVKTAGLLFLTILLWRVLGLGFKGYLISFSAFILCCGIGHILYAHEIYTGNFQLLALYDTFTASISTLTSIFELTGIGIIIYKVYRLGAKKEILVQTKSALVLLGLSSLKK